MWWADVYDTLATAVAATSAPTVDTVVLERLLYQAQRVDCYGRSPGGPLLPWAASHAYAVGARVRATATDSDHVYVVTAAGTSASSAPVWPSGIGATVTDGTVTWQEAWVGTWALAAAARDGWRLKAGQLASANGSVQVGDVRIDRTQRLAQCLKMADYYGRQVASVPVVSDASACRDLLVCDGLVGNA